MDGSKSCSIYNRKAGSENNGGFQLLLETESATKAVYLLYLEPSHWLLKIIKSNTYNQEETRNANGDSARQMQDFWTPAPGNWNTACQKSLAVFD
jgi:hypothetical protein